jgi:hypothetical protein
MVGNLAVVPYGGANLLQWYVATADGTLIFGPFSSLEEALAVAKETSRSDSVSA